jgi:hypothetical protein
MSVRRLGALVLVTLLSACAVTHTPPVVRAALLAPFEGRYREVGYNALYSARLAVQDAGGMQVEILPIDDGGTPESAADRARALTFDPLVRAVVVLGYNATEAQTLRAFGDLPVLVVGDWGAQPETERVFILANPMLDDLRTTPPRIEVTDAAALPAPFVCSEVCALEQFPRLRAALDGITVVSSGQLPNTDFTERYRAGNEFAPQPGLLASLTYDAAKIATSAALDTIALNSVAARSEIATLFTQTTFDGINGQIRFADGYWADAPIHRYRFEGTGQLVEVAS